ncbi:MAG: glycerol-3-phosphate dehydrogenase/oxidase [Thermomicrobiales bacterium]
MAPGPGNAGPNAGEERFDLIVIGAGINGAGIAREAALRGERVLLLDKGDIANGTTAWATRLIHGGLRYLEHGEVGLVRESLRERERLLRIAPHLVRPLPLMIPIYRGDRRGRLLIGAGMLAYDTLSFDKSLPRHRLLGGRAAAQREPGLASAGLLGAALYFDAQVEFAERLAVENALDARAHGGTVRTYHQVDRLLSQEGQVGGVTGHDVQTGNAFTALAPAVINVAGPWVDRVLAGTPQVPATRLIGGTKGSHIIVAPFPGAPNDALYIEARQDGRPYFIVPWNGLYLIGTTDTHYDGDLDEVVAADWEIEFLLAETNRVIPSARLTPGDVLYTYAGVRPLPFGENGSEGSISRRHDIVDHGQNGGPKGLYSVVGGKLTTYRELAEQAVDYVRQRAGRPEVMSRTAALPLPGGRSATGWEAFRERFLQESPLPRQASDHLLRVYGSRAVDILASAESAALRQIIDPYSGAIAAEIPWAMQQEAARTLADVLARRTMIGWGPSAGVGADRAAASVAREVLGWDAERAEAEVQAYRRWIARYRPRALAE